MSGNDWHVPKTPQGPPGKTPFGDRLWYARQALGPISQEKLAERAPGDLRRLTVQGLESGRYKGNSADALKGLAAAFDLPLSRVADYFDGAYGEPSAEAAQKFLAGPPEGAKRVMDPRYPNREEAIELLVRKGEGSRELTAAAANSATLALDGAEDQPLSWWMDQIGGQLRVLRRGTKELGIRELDEDDE